ncbi:MAG: DUF3391 domain-containing protein, partial [Rhodoferax sp.]
MADEHYLSMDQLRVGLYIHLDLKWFEHPFAFGHFKIKSEEQIKVIRSLSLKSVRYAPELSEGSPPPPVAAPPAPVPDAAAALAASIEPELSPIMLAKRAMMEQMQLRRDAAARIEKAFVSTANTIRDIEKNLYSRPLETVQQTTKLIAEIADSMLGAPELVIHVMGDKMGGEELYFHSLNVSMLSMMMAR